MPLVWMFVCVVLVIGLAYWFTKYVVGRGKLGGFIPAAQPDQIKILGRKALGRDQQLVLIQAGDKYLLLGVTGSAISRLAEFTPEEAAGWTGPVEQTAGEQAPAFGEALKNAIQLRRKR